MGDAWNKLHVVMVATYGLDGILADRMVGRDRNFPTVQEASEWAWKNTPPEVLYLNNLYLLTGLRGATNPVGNKGSILAIYVHEDVLPDEVLPLL